MTITTHIAPSDRKAATPKIHTRINHHRAAVTSVHSDVSSHTSRQDRHQRNPKPDFDSVNRTTVLCSCGVPFAKGFNICGRPGKATKPEFMANRTI